MKVEEMQKQIIELLIKYKTDMRSPKMKSQYALYFNIYASKTS